MNARTGEFTPPGMRARAREMSFVLLSIAVLYGKLTYFFKKGGKKLSENNYKTWMCIICGWIYEEEKGCPEEGLAPGTRWEEVPDYWVCPDCGAGKEDFEMIEV